MKCPFVIKICTKCKRILVANEMNFCKQKTGKYGLNSRCKKCHCNLVVQCRNENKEKYKQYNKQYFQNNKDKEINRHRVYVKNNEERIKEYNKKYNEEHKKEKDEYMKKYNEKHKEHYKEYRENNKEHIKEYYENNKEHYKEYMKKYRENNPEKVFNYATRRRQLEENQGEGITKEQWFDMMEYFEFKCAYSGEYIGGDSKHRTIDHIIPLNKGGEHEVWNCIPCFDSYNYSKYTSNMEEWYKKQDFFSEERLSKIYEWIEYAYKKWK